MTGAKIVLPPWRQYAGAESTWSGWRQGKSEPWLLNIWLPFWQSLSEAEREEYLRRWPPPSEDWRRALENWR